MHLDSLSAGALCAVRSPICASDAIVRAHPEGGGAPSAVVEHAVDDLRFHYCIVQVRSWHAWHARAGMSAAPPRERRRAATSEVPSGGSHTQRKSHTAAVTHGGSHT